MFYLGVAGGLIACGLLHGFYSIAVTNYPIKNTPHGQSLQSGSLPPTSR